MLLRVTAKYTHTHTHDSQREKEREGEGESYNGISHQCAGRMSAAISWPKRQTGSGVSPLSPHVVGQVGTLKVMPKNDIKRIAREWQRKRVKERKDRERGRAR